MPRRPRVLVDRAMYHVYSRVSRREGIFAQEGEPEALRDLLIEVKRRDGFEVLAWCLMTNHVHLLLRTGDVPLSRSIRSVQGRFAFGYNRRHGLVGPLWQSRYKAKLVGDDTYFRRLVAYIHLNPVVAGLAQRPGQYRWSGHAELVGRRRPELLDAERTLALFADDPDDARRAYLTLTAALRRERPGRPPGPDWDEAPGPVAARVPQARREAPANPAPLDLTAFIRRAAEVLAVPLGVLGGRRQDDTTTQAREALALVATERLRCRLSEVAAALGKSPETASRWITRGAQRRLADPAFAAKVAALARAVDLGDVHLAEERMRAYDPGQAVAHGELAREYGLD